METIWIDEPQLSRALLRNEAFWNGELDEGPLLWITVPGAKPVPPVPEPARDEELWTNVDYVIAATEAALRGTHYAGDALPVFCPWLGPDQFAAWLGADLELRPRQFTSWSTPFVQDWDEHPQLRIDPENRWWRLYLQVVQESVRAGAGKWVTGYPDLHTGIDALSALRGPENLALDLVQHPAAIERAMAQLTELWKFVVDTVSDIVVPAGQGTSNWTMGWSKRRFLCVGQNDFSCMISPAMFETFCWQDNLQCCAPRRSHAVSPGRSGSDSARAPAAAIGATRLHPVDSGRGQSPAVAMAGSAAANPGRREIGPALLWRRAW